MLTDPLTSAGCGSLSGGAAVDDRFDDAIVAPARNQKAVVPLKK
jgi:hypothetical protein